MKVLMIYLFSLLSLFSVLAWPLGSFAVTDGAKSDAGSDSKPDTTPLAYLPVQDGGRIKPFEALARETMQLVYGRETFKTPQGESRPAREIVMTWMLVPQYWDSQKIIEINHKGLKDSLQLAPGEKYFSPLELIGSSRYSLVSSELGNELAKKDKLNPYFQAAARLDSQMRTYLAFKQGTALRLVPPQSADAKPSADGRATEAEKWIAVSELKGEAQAKFSNLVRSFIQALPNTDANGAPPKEKDPTVPKLGSAVDDFKAFARAQNPALYPSDRDIALEVHLKVYEPFMFAWIFYLSAAIFLGFAWQSGRKFVYRAGWTLALIGFSLHCYGFFLRMYLTGRPPVSNMYESVIWVSFGAFVISMLLEASQRRYMSLIAGCVVGVICLIIADLAPTILDQSLQPLEPVLRSNLWLTIHVLTITLSYSAFFLAWGLGNMGLGFALKGERLTTDRMRALVQSVYRSIQVGVVLLAAGIILGGIWADYSWGRFWGWDPKETWALIALLGYVAMLHGRLVGWVRNLGMLASSVVAFNLVIMAWYGVNYVLGAGLHTYGFGAGGIQYVAGFVILNLIYVGYSVYVSRSTFTPRR